MHEIMVMIAREDAELNVRIQRRNAGHHRQIVVHIGTPILANRQHIDMLADAFEEGLILG
jgi:hypothetical protein